MQSSILNDKPKKHTKKKFEVSGTTKEEKKKSAKKMISEGYSCKDISLSSFSDQEKKDLKNYEKELKTVDNHQNELRRPFFRQPWVIISGIIILLVPLIIVVRRVKK